MCCYYVKGFHLKLKQAKRVEVLEKIDKLELTKTR